MLWVCRQRQEYFLFIACGWFIRLYVFIEFVNKTTNVLNAYYVRALSSSVCRQNGFHVKTYLWVTDPSEF